MVKTRVKAGRWVCAALGGAGAQGVQSQAAWGAWGVTEAKEGRIKFRVIHLLASPFLGSNASRLCRYPTLTLTTNPYVGGSSE